MVVVDFIIASALTVAFTVVFSAIAQTYNQRTWREMPPSVWLVAVASWVGGTHLVVFDDSRSFQSAWAVVLVALASLGFAAFHKWRSAPDDREERRELGDNMRLAIALYFCLTLLLLLCATSLRFYIMNLS